MVDRLTPAFFQERPAIQHACPTLGLRFLSVLYSHQSGALLRATIDRKATGGRPRHRVLVVIDKTSVRTVVSFRCWRETTFTSDPSDMARLFLVTALVMVLAGSGRSAPQDAVTFDSRIYFGNESRLHGLLAAPPTIIRTRDMPKCVREQGATEGDPCIADEDYDESIRAYVTLLIRGNEKLNALVSDPILSNLLNDSLLFSSVDKPTTRFGDPDLTQESPVCIAQETIIYPKRAKTAKEDWVFVVNQENVQQAIRVEKCISEGRNCNLGMPLQGSATAKCRQKYVYKRMLTVGSNIIEPEEVLMPSCCVCYTTNTDFDIASRVRNDTVPPPMTPSGRVPIAPPEVTRSQFLGSTSSITPIHNGRFLRPVRFQN